MPTRGLESEPERKLKPSGRLSDDRFTEKGRTEISDVARVIHVVQDIEGIEAEGNRRSLVLLSGCEKEIARPAKIQIRVAWPLQAVARYAGRPVVRQAVVVVILPRGFGVGLAGVQRNRHAELE